LTALEAKRASLMLMHGTTPTPASRTDRLRSASSCPPLCLGFFLSLAKLILFCEHLFFVHGDDQTLRSIPTCSVTTDGTGRRQNRELGVSVARCMVQYQMSRFS
jgi:hypothetical protein